MNLWFNCWVSLKTFLYWLSWASPRFSNGPFTDFKYNHSIKGLGEEPFSKKNNYHITPYVLLLTWAFDWTFFSCLFSIYKSGNPKKSREYLLFTFFFLTLVFFLFGNICKIYTVNLILWMHLSIFCVHGIM